MQALEQKRKDVAALRQDRVDSLWVINGAMNAEMFNLYTKTQLVPTLRAGDVVILDNLSSHKSPAAAAALRDPLLIAEELRRARLAFDRLIGRATTEDMLDTLFGRFCIGK